ICRPTSGSTNCAADSIYAVYSTTPTTGQSGNFANHGTLRWENLTSAAPESHFFWEQAEAGASPGNTDTLQIIVDRGPSIGATVQLSAACGVIVDLKELAFLDSTYVRSSGNFTHALIGEGGGG